MDIVIRIEKIESSDFHINRGKILVDLGALTIIIGREESEKLADSLIQCLQEMDLGEKEIKIS